MIDSSRFAPTRRQILKGIAAAGVSTAMPFAGLSRLAFAADGETGGPILVVLHLRGGCDGLALVSPATDPDFIAARASDLRVAADGPTPGFALANGPASTIDFRLHNAAGGMNELYKSGNLAFIHACGLTDATRSHFVATDMIERGVGSESDLQKTDAGWIARALNAPQGGLKIQAIAANGVIGGDLDGVANALAVPSIDNGLPYIGGAGVANALWTMYASDKGPVGPAGRMALQLPEEIDRRVPRDLQGRVQPYQPVAGVNYGPAAELAGPLKTVAQLIKMDLGLKTVTLDYGNWDMHEYESGRFKPMAQKMSDGLAAFWNDLSAYHDRITLVTLTEFGRRLRSNASAGTDHGRGSLMTVLGGQVKGGRFYGQWPGLKSEQLDEGVDLAVTTDYRQVLTEVLAHAGMDRGAGQFPNYKYPGPLGLL
jgi:uncharacterized protein (DUF1501 family)